MPSGGAAGTVGMLCDCACALPDGDLRGRIAHDDAGRACNIILQRYQMANQRLVHASSCVIISLCNYQHIVSPNG